MVIIVCHSEPVSESLFGKLKMLKQACLPAGKFSINVVDGGWTAW